MKRENYVSPHIDIVIVDCTVNTLAENSGTGEGSPVMLSWLIGE